MLMSRANGCNIVCQQLPTLLEYMLHMHVASNCTPCCNMLLGIVVQSLKPVKLLAMCKGTQQLLGVIGQQCCAHFARALKL